MALLKVAKIDGSDSNPIMCHYIFTLNFPGLQSASSPIIGKQLLQRHAEARTLRGLSCQFARALNREVPAPPFSRSQG